MTFPRIWEAVKWPCGEGSGFSPDIVLPLIDYAHTIFKEGREKCEPNKWIECILKFFFSADSFLDN
jgi:hypothetical protein